jgi:hypothetical protein
VRFHLLVERRPMGGDRLVERAVLWTVALVAVAASGRRRVGTRRAVRRVSGGVHTPRTERGVPRGKGRGSAACGVVGTGGHRVRAVAVSGQRQRYARAAGWLLGEVETDATDTDEGIPDTRGSGTHCGAAHRAGRQRRRLCVAS